MKTKLILLSLLLISCGSRKVNKSVIENKEETKTEIKTESKTNIESKAESNVKTEIERVVDTKKNIVSVTETFKPIDNNKPASVIDAKGNKIGLNNSEYSKTETSDLSNEKETNNKTIDSVGKSDLKAQNDTKTDSKGESKKSGKVKLKDSERNNTFVTIGLIICIGLVIGFFLWIVGKKFRDAKKSIS